jgi:PAS domain S-box-containing protein
MVETLVTSMNKKEEAAENLYLTIGQDFYRDLIEFSPDSLLVLDAQGKLVEANPSGCKLFEYSHEELLQMRLAQIIFPLDFLVLSDWQAAAAEGENHLFEQQIITKNGQFLTVETHAGRLPGGACLLLMRNITKRSQEQALLRQSAELYRTFVRNLPDAAVLIFDHDLRYILAEGPILNKRHFSQESIEGKTLWEIVSAEPAKALEGIYRAALAGQEVTTELTFQDCIYSIHAFPARNEQNEVVAGIIMSQDITKARQTELALQSGEARYRQLFLSTKRQALELDLLHRVRSALSQQLELPALFQTVVEMLYRDFGYSQVALYMRQGEFLVLQHQFGYEPLEKQLPVSQVLSDRNSLTAGFNGDVKASLDDTLSEICIPLFNQSQLVGSLNVESGQGQKLTLEDLRVLKALGEYVSLAINRARLYQEIKESAERLQMVVTNAPVILYSLDRDGIMTLCEGRGLEDLGLQPGQLVGLSVFDLYRDNPQVMANTRRALAGETFLYTAEIGGFIFETSCNPVRDAAGEIAYIICVSTNITEYKKAEEEIKIRAIQQAAVADLDQRALAAAELNDLLDEAARLVSEVLNLGHVSIMEMLPEQRGLLLRAGVGWRPEEVGTLVVPLKVTSFGSYVYDSRQPVIVPDWSAPPPALKITETLKKHQVSSSLGVVIYTGNQTPFGVLAAHSTRLRRFTQNDTHFIQAVANVLATAIERQRVEAAVQVERDFAVQVMTTMGQALAVLDSSFRIDYANPAFVQLLGYSPEELTGKTPFELIPPEYHSKINQTLEGRAIEAEVKYEVYLVCKDGRRKYVWINAVPVMREGQLTGIIAVFSDLTERKRVEAEILKALEKERELGELKTRFITTTSHEFRTPLTTIQTNAELLKYYHLKYSQEKKDELLNRIIDAVRAMTGMLKDILVMGQAEASQLSFKPEFLNLTKFSEEIVQNFQAGLTLAGDKHYIRFKQAGQEPAGGTYLDKNLTGQIISNLLSNAIKYSPEGGEISFNLKFEPESTIIEVKDQGIGIATDDLERLFQAFHRGKNIKNISGTGLGLSIVKHCIKLQDGTIEVDTELDKGSIFRVSLPVKSAETLALNEA